MNLAIIVLGAGKGTRMESDLAKVLHPLCGQPLIAWVLERAQPLEAQRTVVIVGHQAEAVEAAVNERFDGMEFVTQTTMLGTGHAVQQAEALLGHFDGDIVVTCGDVPLIATQTLRDLVEQRRRENAAAALLIGTVQEPGSYGRVICDANGQVSQIVEAKDASPEVLARNTVNAGTYCFDSQALWPQLRRIDNSNRSGEYYLTDVIGLMTAAGQPVFGTLVSEREMTGINTRAQLQALESELEREGMAHV